jgi:hypothetical protein
MTAVGSEGPRIAPIFLHRTFETPYLHALLRIQCFGYGSRRRSDHFTSTNPFGRKVSSKVTTAPACRQKIAVIKSEDFFTVRLMSANSVQTEAKPSNSRRGETNVRLVLGGWSCLAWAVKLPYEPEGREFESLRAHHTTFQALLGGKSEENPRISVFGRLFHKNSQFLFGSKRAFAPQGKSCAESGKSYRWNTKA